MDGSIFREILTDHVDEQGTVHMDGYKTGDPNEGGVVIGFFIKGTMYWRDPEYQFDPYVKEELSLLQEEYKKQREELEKEIKQAVTRVVYDDDAKPRMEYTNGSPLKVKLGFIRTATEKIMKLI